MSREIPLTRGLVAIVDDADYEMLSVFKWQSQRGARGTWYAVRMTSRKDGKRRTLGMHREITGDVPGFEVDHKDHDGLNNQRENLRVCTRQQNGANRQCPPAPSGYRGVSWHKINKTWRARAHVNNKRVHIGDFGDPLSAAIARDKVVAAANGEFAILNFPELRERA